MSHKPPGGSGRQPNSRGGYTDILRGVRHYWAERDGPNGRRKADDSSNGRRMRNLRK